MGFVVGRGAGMASSVGTMRSVLENGATIKLLGDSITAGGGSSDNSRSGDIFITIEGIEYRRQTGQKCWASLLASHIKGRYPKCRVINNGCSNITSSLVKQHLAQLSSKDDDIIIIMIGTNDRKQIDGMTALHNNLSDIVNQLKSQNRMVILMSPNPSTSENEAYPNRLYHMIDVNEVIKQVAAKENVMFISHFDSINLYLEESGRTIEDLMIGKNDKADGLHPSDEAHYLMYQHIIRGLGLV